MDGVEQDFYAETIYKILLTFLRNENEDYSTREIMNRLTERSIIEQKSIKDIGVLGVIDYLDYNDPYYYTSHQYYLEIHLKLTIYKRLGISFDNFMKIPIREINSIINTLSKLKDTEPDNGVDNILNNQLGDLAGMLEEMSK